jgi:hypothetical protein
MGFQLTRHSGTNQFDGNKNTVAVHPWARAANISTAALDRGRGSGRNPASPVAEGLKLSGSAQAIASSPRPIHRMAARETSVLACAEAEL